MYYMPKIEVIPAINAENFEDVKKKIKLIEPYCEWVHLDIADGTFTPNTLWHNAEDLLSFDTPLKIEMHLMIADMDIRWEEWILPNVNRIIFHKEVAHDPLFVLEKIKKSKKEAGVAIRPDTDWMELKDFFENADLVQVLAVNPGLAGQAFKPEILDKVKHIRQYNSRVIIEVDGGINLETGKQCAEAGANILVSANYIFGSEDISGAINNLKNI